MKKFWYLLVLMCCMIALPSCKDDDDDVAEIYKEWREDNEAFILKIKASGEYSELDIPSKMNKIYVKVIKEGEGEDIINFTSTVKVNYKGTLIDGTVFDDRTPPYYDPASFRPIDVVDGFGAALQYMHVGDKWEVWIPWDIAYGSGGRKDSNGNYTIRPYTALHFEIEVLEIVEK